MFRSLRACALAFSLSAPFLAHAQSPTTFHFNIAAGGTVPTGDFSTFNSTGYNLIAGIGVNPAGLPLGFRVEGLYNEFGHSSNLDTFGDNNQNAHASGVTVSATYNLMAPSASQSNTLYVIGGVGYYNTIDVGDFDSQSNIGYNVGAGFKFPLSGFSAYIEARYHSVSTQFETISFVPISFGLVF